MPFVDALWRGRIEIRSSSCRILIWMTLKAATPAEGLLSNPPHPPFIFFTLLVYLLCRLPAHFAVVNLFQTTKACHFLRCWPFILDFNSLKTDISQLPHL